MGRKRKAGIMLPEHVHKVKWASGTVAYYYQKHRGTPRQGDRYRLPDNPQSAFFFTEIKRFKDGVLDEGPFAKMIDGYMASPRYAALSDNTKREYNRHLLILRKAWAEFDASHILVKDVATVRDELGDRPATANARVKVISSLYKWGCQLGYSERNPAASIDMLRVGEHQPWPQWVWDSAITRFRAELVAACMLGRFTQQRLGDVLDLKLSDIEQGEDEHNNHVEGFRVVQQKTGKSLFIPIRNQLRPLIEETRRKGHFCIVARPDGTQFTTDQFHAMWSREMKRDPELKKIRDAGFSFHGLRKGAVVSSAHKGLSGSEIGSLTGQTLPTVQHYSKGVDQKRLAIQATIKLEKGNQ